MFRLVYLALWITLFLIPLVFLQLVPKKYSTRIYRIFYKAICFMFRIKVKSRGEATKDSPVIYVSNHISYTDILVLGSVLPASFVSKAEVAKWPVVGWIAHLTGTLFIKRKRGEAGSQIDQLKAALESGKDLIIFPEGTTGDGVGVLPVKSSLFKIAEEMDITIQPVTLKYTHINGLPVQRNEKSDLFWIGDMDFQPHFKTFVNLGVVRTHVTLHEPIRNSKDRKALATKVEEKIASGFQS